MLQISKKLIIFFIRLLRPGQEEAGKIISGIAFVDDPYQTTNFDVLLILTDWPEFKELDLEKIKKNLKTPIIVDGVNTFSSEVMRKMGFTYKGVGRE